MRAAAIDPVAGVPAAAGSGSLQSRGETTFWVLSALGGAGAMLLWLKLGGLLNLRSVGGGDFAWSYLATALAGGAFIALLGQAAWGAAGAWVSTRLGGGTSARDLRIAWGAAAIPQVAGVVLLLPLDLLVVGERTFTTEALRTPVQTAWAAASVALAVSLAVWSCWVLVRGVQGVARVTPARGALLSALGLLCLATLAAALLGGTALIAGVF